MKAMVNNLARSSYRFDDANSTNAKHDGLCGANLTACVVLRCHRRASRNNPGHFYGSLRHNPNKSDLSTERQSALLIKACRKPKHRSATIPRVQIRVYEERLT